MRAVQQVAAGPNHPNRAVELKPALQFKVSIRGQIRHAVYAGQRCCLKDEYEQTQACCHATTNRPQQKIPETTLSSCNNSAPMLHA
jgi:hypothetical protein